MIRVIEHGRKNDRKIKCNVCDCTFLFGEVDVTNKDERISVDEWIDHYYIRCPDCGHDIYLGDKL